MNRAGLETLYNTEGITKQVLVNALGFANVINNTFVLVVKFSLVSSCAI